MRPENYSSLKSAGKVSLQKAKDVDDNDIIQLVQKCYDANTGEALTDSVMEISANNLANDKTSLTAEKSALETRIAGLTAIISDIESL